MGKKIQTVTLLTLIIRSVHAVKV